MESALGSGPARERMEIHVFEWRTDQKVCQVALFNDFAITFADLITPPEEEIFIRSTALGETT